MIQRRTSLLLGLSQLVSWGVTYYLIGAFGELIIADLDWSRVVVYGGFSAALVVMGLSSPAVGRLIDRYGGRWVMTTGSVLGALGCAALASVHTVPAYYAGWVVLGVSMRCNLYDAAFATLARIGGPTAKRPISHITLLGGLASTVFWPIGHSLAAAWGWRAALACYAGFALLTVPLNLAIPEGRYGDNDASSPLDELAVLTKGRGDRVLAGALYALIVTLTAFLNSAMSAHMIGILAGMGIALSLAVWIAALRGIGQTLGRTVDVLFGHGVHPLNLNLAASLALPLCFVAALASGQSIVAAVAFAFVYGAANGVMTITRGTVPLVLFDFRSYGGLVGNLLVPSFVVSAAAPIVYAFMIERGGEPIALLVSIGVASIAFAAALALKLKFSPAGDGGPQPSER